MGKKKLSALELKMKKMAVLANDKFAAKADTYTKQEADTLLDTKATSSQGAKADAAKTLLDSLGLSVVDGQVCQTYNT